jgi:phosphatidylserine/phosphatidylglycerophosphate/cardiolipin synthase-like enzyme
MSSVQHLARTWFLTAEERGNPDTQLDVRHGPDGWTTGNLVRPLVHGAAYFRELHRVVSRLGAGDLLLFTDWRGDPDERLDGPGSEVGDVLAAAARRGADVRGLVWRSHLDRFQFSAAENRHLGQEVEDAGGQCLLDMRVRVLGSHHQKLVVVRHARRPDDDVAFVGGIDLCHSRRDDSRHLGDVQRQPMARVYGRRPPWHDLQLQIQGPAVGAVETVFRERWEDPAPLSRNPVHLVGERLLGEDRKARPLPPQRPDPAPVGPHAVQVLRTYPVRHPGYPFARHGERSIARGYLKALGRARGLVYLEDQYLWSWEVAQTFARALARTPSLHMVAVIPAHPDQDGRAALPPNLVGRAHALRVLHRAAPGRFAAYALENAEGTPIYVHAKVAVIDDVWACVGSDNTNRRSWTHDSELSCAVVDGERTFARDLRLQLVSEHLGLELDDDARLGLLGAEQTFDAFRDSARRLDAWHAGGRHGPRPPGQLRTYRQPSLSRTKRAWSGLLYRTMYDPDGRTPRDRLAQTY